MKHPLPTELNAKIDEIRSWMFLTGSQQRVAKAARISEGYVSQILNGDKKPTPKFMAAAVQVMNENKARFEIGSTMKIA